MTDAPKASTPARRAARLALRSFALLAIWVIIAEGDFSALHVGAAISVAAAAVSLVLLPGRLPAVRIAGLLRYIVFFATRSVAGGVDVAARALSPRMPLAPGMVDYPVRLDEGPMRVMFAHTVSLLPGTVSVRLEPDSVEIHALDCGSGLFDDLAAIEDRVADVFGVALPPRSAVCP